MSETSHEQGTPPRSWLRGSRPESGAIDGGLDGPFFSSPDGFFPDPNMVLSTAVTLRDTGKERQYVPLTDPRLFLLHVMSSCGMVLSKEAANHLKDHAFQERALLQRSNVLARVDLAYDDYIHMFEDPEKLQRIIPDAIEVLYDPEIITPEIESRPLLKTLDALRASNETARTADRLARIVILEERGRLDVLRSITQHRNT